MKRMAWLLLLVVGSTLSMYAQKSKPAQEMNGTICNSKCVIQTPDIASCDPKCDISGGTDVLIDDAGRVKKISNQEACATHEGKHVVLLVVPSGATEEEETFVIQELHEQPR